jgi:hypothetical protein
MENKQYAVLVVKKQLADKLEKFCQEPPSDCGRGEVVYDEEVKFLNGYRMAIQVVASENPDEEECWTQGVVFDSFGNELGCTDVGESFLGEYHVGVQRDEYVTSVQIETVVR